MKVNVQNPVKLQRALDDVQKGCRARLLDIDDILYATRRAEATLENLAIPKKAWRGCRVVIEPERVSNSYDGQAEGTGVTIERTATGWYVEEICSQCKHLKRNVDVEEFWGFMAERISWECDLLCNDAEDPDCPEHGRWLRIASYGEETGDYRLEDDE